MKRKFEIFTLITILCLTLSNYVININNNKDGVSTNNQGNNVVVNAVEVTVKDIASFLETKEEHYPLSDEFIEKYQQTSGGYIENASKAGIIVDKQQHLPNQKWHFFESWLYPSIQDNSLTWEESAKSRVYNKLLCPELLLWIYEACGVDPNKVRNAKEVAEKGKIEKTHSSTLASQMRACVPWEDLEENILEFMESNS